MTAAEPAPLVPAPAHLQLGAAELDYEHGQLYTCIGEFEEALTEAEPERRERTMLALHEEAVRHFSNEEALMLAAEYPDFETHRSRHERLLQSLDRACASALTRPPSASGTTQRFLEMWLAEHISRDDRLFVEYLRQRSVLE